MAIVIEDVLRRDGSIQRSFDQSAAGTDELVADPGDGQRVVIVSLAVSMSAAGTLAIVGAGGVDLIAPMSLASGIPLVLRGDQGSPALEARSSDAVNLVTTVGAGDGVLVYKIAPAANTA